MTGRTGKGFAARPRSAEAWVAAPEASASAPPSRSANTARLTLDVTPALRRRIKLAALKQGMTLADLLRGMLYDAFPDEGDGTP